MQAGIFDEGIDGGHAADEVSRLPVEETEAEEVVAEESPCGFDPKVGPVGALALLEGLMGGEDGVFGLPGGMVGDGIVGIVEQVAL